MKFQRVKCKSGLWGERFRLRDAYRDFAEFKSFCRMYLAHRRLKFRSAKAAWRKNPLIESSVNPDDFRRVPEKEAKS